MKKKVQITWIHGETVHADFMHSVLGLVSARNRPFELSLSNVRSGPLLGRARNTVAEAFLETKNDYLLMVDTDIVFTPEDAVQLFKASKPIVGGFYLGVNLADNGTFPVALRQGEDGAYWTISKEDVPEKGCIEVDAVGMGFTLVRREVFEVLKPDHQMLFPFAETVVNGRGVGEDIAFCLRAKQEGFQTWLCGDARVGHAKSLVIGS